MGGNVVSDRLLGWITREGWNVLYILKTLSTSPLSFHHPSPSSPPSTPPSPIFSPTNEPNTGGNNNKLTLAKRERVERWAM